MAMMRSLSSTSAPAWQWQVNLVSGFEPITRLTSFISFQCSTSPCALPYYHATVSRDGTVRILPYWCSSSKVLLVKRASSHTHPPPQYRSVFDHVAPQTSPYPRPFSACNTDIGVSATFYMRSVVRRPVHGSIPT